MTKVSIIGSGVVGSRVGRGLLELHNTVSFYDISEDRVSQLCGDDLNATSSMETALQGSELSIVCVPTPTQNDEIDLSSLKSAVAKLGDCLKEVSGYHLVVVKSTIIPLTSEKVVIPILEEHSRIKVGEQLGLCVNPEFLTEIHGSWTDDQTFVRGFFEEPVIVIGEFDKRSGDKLAQLYERLNKPVIRTHLVTAEMIKYAFNCALASRISYWNEIYYVCRALGIDSEIVAKAAGMDPRIGKYGTVHGKAFGGKCLPKDLRAFIHFATGLGYDPKLLKAVQDVNDRIGRERGMRE